jgi:hypothetical protein
VLEQHLEMLSEMLKSSLLPTFVVSSYLRQSVDEDKARRVQGVFRPPMIGEGRGGL